MARPAKSIFAKTGTITKEEEAIRIASEKKLKGNSDNLKPPTHLSPDQKKIFKYIVSETEVSGILGNLDVYIVSQAAVCIDRLQKMESEINNNVGLLENTAFMGSKKSYATEMFRCCNELSLSPQSRAKLSIVSAQKLEKKNPLLAALEDDDEDD
jgi:P27 family predicted phage terminase small subunit